MIKLDVSDLDAIGVDLFNLATNISKLNKGGPLEACAALRIAESAVIVTTLKNNRYNQAATAKALGMNRGTLRKRLVRLGLANAPKIQKN